MALDKCPKCGASENDGRPHDRNVYESLCIRCEPRAEAIASRNVDVLEREAPHLLAPSSRSEASNHDA